MKDKINAVLDELMSLRKEAFKAQNEELHALLGRAMSSIIRVREYLEK